MKICAYKKLNYVLREPKEFSTNKKYPVVIYLHGAGGRGDNIQVIVEHPFFSATELWLKDAISIAPQCYEDSWFSIFEQLQEFIKYVSKLEYVDTSRVYVVGASMGGYATWQVAMSIPEVVAAIIPICGGGMYWNAGRLVNMGVWAFHGAKDCTVLPEESKKMINSIINCGGKPLLTIYEDLEHDSWNRTFENAEVWKWLLSCESKYQETKSKYDNVKAYG